MYKQHNTELVSAGSEVFDTLLCDFVSIQQVSLGDEDLTVTYLCGALKCHIRDDSEYWLCIQRKPVIQPYVSAPAGAHVQTHNVEYAMEHNTVGVQKLLLNWHVLVREEESTTVTIRQDVHDCRLGPWYEDNARALTVETPDAETLKE